MGTPWLFIVAGDVAFLVGIILVFVGVYRRKKILWILGIVLFLAGAVDVLWCPVCISCGGKITQGTGWSGICCVQSWRSTRQILWWELITEPSQWK